MTSGPKTKKTEISNFPTHEKENEKKKTEKKKSYPTKQHI
jgi:hypothetical protein